MQKKRDIKMDARRRSVNKYDAKKIFVTKASDNHTTEIHVTEVYTSICSHILQLHVLQLNVYTWGVSN